MKADFSSIKLTHCARRAQLEWLFNAKPLAKNFINFGAAGNIAHYILEDWAKEPNPTFNVNEVILKIADLNNKTQANIDAPKHAKLALALHDIFKQKLLHPYQPEGVELYLEKDLTFRDVDITLCGTIDKVYIVGDTLVLRDYKCIWANDWISRRNNYLISAQLPLYMWLLYENLDKYPAYAPFFKTNKVQGEFVFLLTGVDRPRVEVPEPLLLELFTLADIEQMLTVGLHNMVDIKINHEAGRLMPQQGRISATCHLLHCPYTDLCWHKTDKQILEWANQNQGEPYDPARHRER